MALNYYPYRFSRIVNEFGYSGNSFLKQKQLYTFRSPKSKQTYWVWIEVYEHDFYAIKFHLKAHRYSERKYSLMTGFNEARPVINTCIAIMLEISKRNPHASFGFIGANMEDESTYITKRFRIYSTLMATYFNAQIFKHLTVLEKSAYMLIRRSVLEQKPYLLAELNSKFCQMYEGLE